MADYSGTPLVKKLGIKEGMSVLFMNAPRGYNKTLGKLPAGATVATKLQADAAFIQYFAEWRRELRAIFPVLKKQLAKDGVLWISWRKQHDDVCDDTDLNENRVRTIGLAEGLVDVKVCAIDEHWSGLKFVWRKKDR